MIHRVVIFIVGVWVGLDPAGASWLEEIGFERLAARLEGASLPTGRGISMTQVEATSSGGGHLPQNGGGRFQGVDGFDGKAFHAHSGESSMSQHARIVGHYLYASEPLTSFGAVSLSPGVTEIDLFHAGVREYLADDFLAPRTANAPITERNAIQNHSWYGQKGTASIAYLNDKLRRLDYSVIKDDYLCVVALANGADSPIPPLMASAYNVLAVGCSNGNHSHGYTHEGLDGGARTKVDLVAPLSATSYATPVVSSAAALLLECADGGDASRSEVMRAILMAGASKAPFAAWQRTNDLPFDPVFGAGELRVDESHTILTEQQWRYVSQVEGSHEIALELEEPRSEVSIVLAWNRQDSFRKGQSLPGKVVDMNLRLYSEDRVSSERVLIQESTSTNENREHVYARGLAGGRYVIVMESDRTVASGIAWKVKSMSNPSLALASDGIRVEGLEVDQSYVLQRSVDLQGWLPVRSFDAEGATLHLEVPADSGMKGFYRLAW